MDAVDISEIAAHVMALPLILFVCWMLLDVSKEHNKLHHLDDVGLDAIGYCWVLLDDWMLLDLIGCCWPSLDSECCWMSLDVLGAIGCHFWMMLGVVECHWMSLCVVSFDVVGCCWMSLDATRVVLDLWMLF